MPLRSLLLRFLTLAFVGVAAHAQPATSSLPAMYFSDTSRVGMPFAKDPSVVDFNGKFLLYYSIPPAKHDEASGAKERSGWGIGIAESSDLVHWQKAGEVLATQAVEKEGIAAPGARVINGVLHLFYQTCGHGAKDAICHATSTDGLHFVKDVGNPVYRPQHMAWSVGRAIDAEVFVLHDTAYLYFATRDPGMVRQLIGLAEAPLSSRLSAGDWTDISIDQPVLAPVLPWEQQCIEAPSVFLHNGSYYLLYAGAYNNMPQQIGIARSSDAVHWSRISNTPLLPNGLPGTWNASESGHPGALVVGPRTFLFFQGNRDGGKTYYLSKVEIGWRGGLPFVMAGSAGATATSASRTAVTSHHHGQSPSQQ